MSAAAVSLALVVASLGQYSNRHTYGTYGTIKKDELEYQQQSFKQWWGQDLVIKLDELPLEGRVPDFRVPYAGHDYPDQNSGTINAPITTDCPPFNPFSCSSCSRGGRLDVLA